ncbi:Splicing factor 3B subunit 2 [Operophtera brumata]|uniref:Splicing factor 3B subunit 2 n=1 Tax=Operophtera brumata TaxID=104452 RepID=A0A0L7KRL1_OPEBR|nr:Splicing factor 3B subunit 2 [Operophtera brumata]
MKIDTPEEFRNKNLPVGGVVLPKALEEALAYKDQRQAALGDEEEQEDEEDDADSDDDNMPDAPMPPVISKQEALANKANKNKRKKKKKKEAKQKRREELKNKEAVKVTTGIKPTEKEKTKITKSSSDKENPMYRQFHRILESFKISETKEEIKEETKEVKSSAKPVEKLKKLSRLSVAELKQLVSRPDVVEMYDVTAKDPKLLVQLKAHRNTVQVPRHWCYKRKTGIMEMRASLQDKEETKTLKAKMRERARPKLGKIDIDYQKLHDAFFK